NASSPNKRSRPRRAFGAGDSPVEGPSPSDIEVQYMLKSISFVAAVVAALSLVSTAHARPKGPETEEDNQPLKPLPPQQKNFPLDQTWSLREMNGKPVPSDLDISLKIDGTLRGSGFTGCNSWSATM